MIYAADPNATTGNELSQRPYETVIPLAARLGLTLDTKFALGQESELAATVVGQTGVVLVAWEHDPQRPSVLQCRSTPPLHSRLVRGDETKMPIIYPDLRLDYKVATHPKRLPNTGAISHDPTPANEIHHEKGRGEY